MLKGVRGNKGFNFSLGSLLPARAAFGAVIFFFFFVYALLTVKRDHTMCSCIFIVAHMARFLQALPAFGGSLLSHHFSQVVTQVLMVLNRN